MSNRPYGASPTQHITLRTDGKPLRFTGVLLGARTVPDEDEGVSGYDDPEPENIQRSDALVISATEGSRSATEVAAEGWTRRPRVSGRLVSASVRAWHAAARLDSAITEVFYSDVE